MVILFISIFTFRFIVPPPFFAFYHFILSTTIILKALSKWFRFFFKKEKNYEKAFHNSHILICSVYFKYVLF